MAAASRRSRDRATTNAAGSARASSPTLATVNGGGDGGGSGSGGNGSGFGMHRRSFHDHLQNRKPIGETAER